MSEVQHQLRGLQSQPLASYLAALGVLRLLHEQKDPDASAAWSEGHVQLYSALHKDELLNFFLEEYQPTPLTSPWNGGSGYYPKDNKEGPTAILASQHPRFEPYRKTLLQVRAILERLGAKDKPDGEEAKTHLLRTLRRELDDESLKWLDAAVVLSEDDKGQAKPRYSPLLGTGGNDGRLEFSNNQMKRLEELFLSHKAKPDHNRELLEGALYGSLSRHLKGGPIGQFDPGSAGGVNLSVGFDGGALLNPWYYVLMIEGALVLASAAVGRFKDPGRTGGSFPFTVNHLGVGHGKLGQDEGNRQEIWLPLWDQPTRYPEIQSLFAEGRAQVGAQQARNPVEFSLALASHGTSRGLSGFCRFGFLQRNGKSYFATPLGYHPVGQVDSAGLIRRVEQRWFHRHRHKLDRPESVARAIRRYDNAVMEHLASKGRTPLVTALERLGELHIFLARSPKLWETIRPLPALDKGWVEQAYDESPEFRLALALSTLGGAEAGVNTLHVRSQLTPYNPQTRQWDDHGWLPRWTGRDVPERMLGLLRHRLLSAHQGEATTPTRGLHTAHTADIEEFIEGRTDDGRLERLLYAFSLIPPQKHDLERGRPPDFLTLPYLLPRLALHQGRPRRPSTSEAEKIERDDRTPPLAISELLSSGKVGAALLDSRRFLLGRGLVIPRALTSHQPLPPSTCRRLAAALLFPISDADYRRIETNILNLQSDISRQEREPHRV